MTGVCAIDNNAIALNTLAENLGTDTECLDLGAFSAHHVALLNEADILVAGPPCQGFSTAGRNDPDDDRNNHVWNVARIAALFLPKVVLIENVRGLLTPKNSKHLDRTLFLLRESGYSVSYSSYNLQEYGIAQRRVRVMIVATRGAPRFRLELPHQERRCLKDALSNMDGLTDFEKDFLDEASEEYKISKRILPGQKLSNVRSGPASVHTWEIPEVFGKVSGKEIRLLETVVKLRRQNRRRSFGDADPVRLSELSMCHGEASEGIVEELIKKNYLRKVGCDIDLKNTFNGKFRRLRWDDVSPTVDTRFGQPRYFLHPEESRGMSVREAARIQSFPDSFRFSGSKAAKYRMIGNAVPPEFAKLVAQTIGRNWASL